MKIDQSVRRYLTVFVSIIFAGVSIIPILSNDIVHAYGLITSRSIELSSSLEGNTTTTYNVSFTTATSSNPLEGVVVDFCSTDPIISDTCTAPSGFTVGSSPSVTSITGLGGAGTWVAGDLNTGRTLTLTNSTSNNVTSGTAVSFLINNVTNPTTVGTFYARILTYASPGGATGYTATNPSAGAAIVDAGGIALSTVQTITITAKVQEQLTFCVYTGGSCGTGSSVLLGNTNGALSTSGPFVDKTTTYSITTNAYHGAVITMEGGTLTDTNGDHITAIGSTATASSSGTDQFGMCTYESSGSTLSFPNATYSSGGGSTCNTQTSQTAGTGSSGGAGTATFGFNTANTGSTYGDEIASATAGTAVGVMVFMANVAITQVAGIYSTTLDFIATGTY
jgi:hypothetical protein